MYCKVRNVADDIIIYADHPELTIDPFSAPMQEPESGGATTFTKADVYVRPKKLAATFFSYLGPDKQMDIGFTEHSGCPILQGEKMITTYWMRDGVTAEEDWTKYDPSGIRILMD